MPTGIAGNPSPTTTRSGARCPAGPPRRGTTSPKGLVTRRGATTARSAAAGREVFAKKGGAPRAALAVKVDPCVLETGVHFPTDLNLLWAAGRKCVDRLVKYRDQFGYALPGWRKAQQWRRQLKNGERTASQVEYRGGPNKEVRRKRAVRDYRAAGRELSPKVRASLSSLCDQPVTLAHWEGLACFHRRLDKHLDLVGRRLLQQETIPAHKKVFFALRAAPRMDPERPYQTFSTFCSR